MADDEHALMARIAMGDQEALHKLYIRYRPRLRRYLWRRLDCNAEAVEDALQETWLAVWRSAPNYRPQGQVAAWIFQIVHRHVAHVRRDHSRRPEGHLQVAAPDSGEDDAFAIAETGSHEQAVVDRLVLRDALRTLSSAHREVLELVFHHGFALAEVAQILDIPLGTVKSRVSYARRALAHAFAAASGDPTAADAKSRERTKR
jgi:RNA polymerase sigma-70 factor, ECF subfamily